MLLIANRQGVQEYLNSSQIARLAGGVSHLGGVEFCDPHVHDFPVGGMSACQTARFTPLFRLPKAFPDKTLGTHNHPTAHASAVNMAANAGISDESLDNAIRSGFPCRHDRANSPLSFSYSDGSARKIDGSPNSAGPGQARLDPEAAGTLTGTDLVMAHSQEVLRIDPNGKTTTNTITRAELAGVQAWLKRISEDDSVPASTFKLLTDSQVTLQSIQKAIRQPATTWLCTHKPILAGTVSHLKTLTEGGHCIHLGKVKAHAGVEEIIIADAAANKVVTQKIIDAGGDLNHITSLMKSLRQQALTMHVK